MEAGGNDKLNTFLSQYAISKETDIIAKYNTNAASAYRDRIQTIVDGKDWKDPPVVKEMIGIGGGIIGKKRPLGGLGSSINEGWDSWSGNDDGFGVLKDIRRNQSAENVGVGGASNGDGRGAPVRSRSTEGMYSKSELVASAANKEGFFAKKISENESRPEGLPPLQGGTYVGFGSTPLPTTQRNISQGGIALKDTISVVSQGFGQLSLVAASAAQSAANVVQAGTKELTTKVKEGGYDHKVNEIVNVVTTKTTEIGQRTWGLMKGVMALASQKVEEYTKEGVVWKGDNWQGNGYNQDFGLETKGYNSSTDAGNSVSGRQFKSVNSSNSWDDWDNKDSNGKDDSGKQEVQNENSWAGWDEAKDDGYESFQHSSTKKSATGQTGKSDGMWSEVGFL